MWSPVRSELQEAANRQPTFWFQRRSPGFKPLATTKRSSPRDDDPAPPPSGIDDQRSSLAAEAEGAKQAIRRVGRTDLFTGVRLAGGRSDKALQYVPLLLQ
jgi:hypothetical protein